MLFKKLLLAFLIIMTPIQGACLLEKIKRNKTSVALVSAAAAGWAAWRLYNSSFRSQHPNQPAANSAQLPANLEEAYKKYTDAVRANSRNNSPKNGSQPNVDNLARQNGQINFLDLSQVSGAASATVVIPPVAPVNQMDVKHLVETNESEKIKNEKELLERKLKQEKLLEEKAIEQFNNVLYGIIKDSNFKSDSNLTDLRRVTAHLNEILQSKNAKALINFLKLENQAVEHALLFEQTFLENYKVIQKIAIYLYQQFAKEPKNDLNEIWLNNLNNLNQLIQDLYEQGPWAKGKAVVKVILNKDAKAIDEIKKSADKAIVSLVWYFYELGLNKGQKSIDLTIESQEIFNFIKSISSSNENARVIVCQIDKEVRNKYSFPNGHALVCFYKVDNLVNNDNVFAIKFENASDFNSLKLKYAVNNALNSARDSFIWLARKAGVTRNIIQNGLPAAIANKWNELLSKNNNSVQLQDLVNIHGIKGIIYCLQKFDSIKLDLAKQPIVVDLDALLAEFDHNELRTANEVILTFAEIQEDLNKKIK